MAITVYRPLPIITLTSSAPIEDWRAALLRASEHHEDDQRFAKALAELAKHPTRGRPSFDAIDAEGAAEMKWLLENGRAANKTEAARQIADRYPGNSRTAKVRRLLKMFNKTHAHLFE